MAKWHKSPEVLEAAQQWRLRCFEGNGSILSEKHLWTSENLDHLDRHFIQSPEEGKGGFLVKLEKQLSSAPPAARQLAAEVLWLIYLAVSSSALRGTTKRMQLKRVWEWSGESFPEAEDILGEVLDTGVANPGPGFNNHKWREFAFAIQLIQQFKRLKETEQNRILDDPWAFAEWLESVPLAPGRQFRHMLLYLLFPDHFERAVTSSHKELIVTRMYPELDLAVPSIDFKDRVAVDRALYNLRPQLGVTFYGPKLDYYFEPLRSKWFPDTKKSTADDWPSDSDLKGWYKALFEEAGVWVIAAGPGARLWSEFMESELVAIGWDYLGDLSAFQSRDDVHSEIQAQQGGNPTNDSLACWQFSHEVLPGDHVIVKDGRAVILGHGVITSDYRFDEARSEYQHVRNVQWKKTGRWFLPGNRWVGTKALTEATDSQDWLHYIIELMYGNSTVEAASNEDIRYTVDDAMEGLFLSQDRFTEILDTLLRKKNVILEGAPGVGKTFLSRRLAFAVIGQKDRDRVRMVQFHQSYAYEDFVQGWRPTIDGGFELRNGVFHQFCTSAAADPDNKYVFVIDEINRSNLSKVLGELMLLIEPDKRGVDYAIPLTYSSGPDDQFYVPENLHILGLMNTADRSLAMVDYALRRRFNFFTLEPAFAEESFSNHLSGLDVPEEVVERIVERMGRLNRTIAADTKNLGPGFEIGHSFFVPHETESEDWDYSWYERVVRQEIEPLLKEYWFDQRGQVEEQVDLLLS